jgi:hypothetical protein
LRQEAFETALLPIPAEQDDAHQPALDDPIEELGAATRQQLDSMIRQLGSKGPDFVLRACGRKAAPQLDRRLLCDSVVSADRYAKRQRDHSRKDGAKRHDAPLLGAA